MRSAHPTPAPDLAPPAEPEYMDVPGYGMLRLIETREDWKRLVRQEEEARREEEVRRLGKGRGR